MMHLDIAAIISVPSEEGMRDSYIVSINSSLLISRKVRHIPPSLLGHIRLAYADQSPKLTRSNLHLKSPYLVSVIIGSVYIPTAEKFCFGLLAILLHNTHISLPRFYLLHPRHLSVSHRLAFEFWQLDLRLTMS